MRDAAMPTQCHTIKAGASYRGKQGLDYFTGIAAETVGSRGLCMHLLTVPPGARAKAHLHEGHETAIYILEGEGYTLFGDQLQFVQRAGAGDIVYIPAGVPHLPVNLGSIPVKAVIARTDPNEQESVVLRPDLEAAADEMIVRLMRGEIVPD